MFQTTLLQGRAAFITGGGTGICRGIALAFARHGCNVAIASRRPEHLDATAKEIAACGVRACALPADVRDAAAIGSAIDQAAHTFGRLDILVNGAAGNFLCRVEDLSPNGFGTVVDIDLKGTFHASKAALPWLRASRGVVLNISATLHYGGTPAQSHVSAAKAGVDALTRNLAVEWGPDGIRVVGIAPGAIDGTEGIVRLLPDAARAAVTRRVPVRRLGSIDEIASAALFLCSDLASYINGETLVVDGGLSLTPGL
jgi:peroxisomal 2,4-dienoyl-CoA reductase